MYNILVISMILVHVFSIILFSTWFINHINTYGARYISSSIFLGSMIIILIGSFWYLIFYII